LDKWQEDIANYITGCIRYQKAKADKHCGQTKLVLMRTRESPFEEIAMELVSELLESEEFYTNFFIIDRFTKVQYYMPAKTTWIAADVTNIYFKEIW